MSPALAAIALGLRLFEKPHLSRVTDPAVLRRGFERRSRLYFPVPRGTRVAARPDCQIVWRTGARRDAAILYLHGGGYIFGSPRTHAALAARLASRCGVRVILPRYRLAPEHPFPASFEDVQRCVSELEHAGLPPARIVLGGDSAGGGLALAVAATRRFAGTFAMSALTDLTFSGASLQQNARADPLLPAHRTRDLTDMFLAGADPTDPRASPLFASFDRAGPIWFSVSQTEILRDDTLRLARRLAAERHDITLHAHPDAPHVWPFFAPYAPEAARTLGHLSHWIKARLPLRGES